MRRVTVRGRQSSLHEFVKRLLQVLPRPRRYALEQFKGKFPTDDRSNLSYFFRSDQSIKARHQRSLQCCGHDRWSERIGQVWPVVRASDSNVQDRLGQLLDEKRYSVGVRDNPVNYLLSRNSSVGNGINQRGSLARVKSAQCLNRDVWSS